MSKQQHLSRRGLMLALTLSTAVAVTAGVAVAATSTGPSTSVGIIHVLSTSAGTGGGGGKVLITGFIGDHGTGYPANQAGKRVANGNFQRLILSKGTILLNKAKLDAAVGRAYGKLVVDSTNCSAQVAASGKLPVVGGTGAYSSLGGSVNITVSAGFILPRYKSGSHKGKCNESNAAQPTASLQLVYGSGTVTLGG